MIFFRSFTEGNCLNEIDIVWNSPEAKNIWPNF